MGIQAKKIIRQWKKKPSFRKQYESVSLEYTLARALIAARLRAKLTQADVAKRMRTTQSVIARLEGGQQQPTLATLQRYAKATGSRIEVKLYAA